MALRLLLAAFVAFSFSAHANVQRLKSNFSVGVAAALGASVNIGGLWGRLRPYRWYNDGQVFRVIQKSPRATVQVPARICGQTSCKLHHRQWQHLPED
jgi:hypothetical protein